MNIALRTIAAVLPPAFVTAGATKLTRSEAC